MRHGKLIVLVFLFCFFHSVLVVAKENKGIRNFGNSCYMNSTLQSFFQLKPLHEMLKKDAYLKGSVPFLFDQLLEDLAITNNSVTPQALWNSVKKNYFKNSEGQQDASSFMRKFFQDLNSDKTLIAYTKAKEDLIKAFQNNDKNLSTDIISTFLFRANSYYIKSVEDVKKNLSAIIVDLKQEQAKMKPSKPYLSSINKATWEQAEQLINAYDWNQIKSYVNDVNELKETIKKTIGLQYQSILTCKECKNTSVSEEFEYQLALPIHGNTLESCLEKFTQAEMISDFTCSQCNKKNFVKKTIFKTLPTVLILSFKRWKWETASKKIMTNISIPPNLVIQNVAYNLKAMILHQGGVGYGHYTAFTKDTDDYLWRYYDDSRVSSTINEIDVGKLVEKVVLPQGCYGSFTPYVLFYQRNEEEKLEILKNKLSDLRKSVEGLNISLGSVANKLKELRSKLIQLLEQKKPMYEKDKLEAFAEGVRDVKSGEVLSGGYGYKTGNLSELKKITTWINQQLNKEKSKITVKVPDFLGISSEQVKTYLQAHGLDVLAVWKKFQALKAEIKANKNTLTPAAEEALKVLQEKITQIFKNEASYFQKDNKQEGSIAHFLKTVIKPDENKDVLLMVRSTGKEDTETLANAGGNESVSAVNPTLADISMAMGAVVASYFGKKSLGQRLAFASTRDEKEIDAIFTEEPFMPVLIQKMTGEKMGGVSEIKIFDDLKKIPVSGVMFTQEAEGSTEGITHIQAAYGHNEGVVNSLISVDTYYVGSTGVIHQIIRRKPKRLVSRTIEEKQADTSPLKFVPNPAILQKEQTLSQVYVQVLKIIGDGVQDYYQKPMDIEFVIDQAAGEISLVQARPIVYKKTLAPPSYLRDLKQVINAIHKGIVIGVAGGSLRVIDDEKSMCIVEDDLPKALNKYLAHVDKEKIKCVITGKIAPSTSHEATTFRGQGIPVIYTSDFSEVKNLKPTQEEPLVIDVQRSIVVKTSRASLISNVEPGWFSHPIPRQLSLWSDMSKLPTFARRLQEQVVDQKDMKKDLRMLVDWLKTADKSKEQEVLATLAVIVKRVSNYTNENKKFLDQDLKKQLGLINLHVIQAAYEISEVIKKIDKPRDLRLLYSLKFLEAVLFQDLDLDILQGYSFATVLKIVAEEAAAQKRLGDIKLAKEIKNPEEIKMYLRQLIKGVKVALTFEVEKKWQQFVQELSVKDEKTIRDFVKKIGDLQKFNIFGLWLNHDFMNYAGDKLVAFNQDYESSKVLIEKLRQKKETIDALNMTKWEDSENFQKQWQYFSTEILGYFLEQLNFQVAFGASGKLGKKAGLALMKFVVEIFDQSIKSVTGSKLYSLNKKIVNFRIMLQVFLDLLKSWLNFPNTFEYYPGYIGDFGGSTAEIRKNTWLENKNQDNPGLQIILTNMKSRTYPFEFNKAGTIFTITQEDELFPYTKKVTEFNNEVDRLPFSVASLALGAVGQTDMTPVTLEEFFTVVHQSLLNLINNLMKKEGIDQIAKPAIVFSMENLLNRVRIEGQTISMIGVNFEANELQIFYNLPLRQHSSLITLKYKKRTNLLLSSLKSSKEIHDICSISVFFFGSNETPDKSEQNKRWNVIEKNIEAFSKKLDLQIFELKKTESGILFSWDISRKEAKILEYISKIIEQTGDYSLKGSAKAVRTFKAAQSSIESYINGLQK